MSKIQEDFYRGLDALMEAAPGLDLSRVPAGMFFAFMKTDSYWVGEQLREVWTIAAVVEGPRGVFTDVNEDGFGRAFGWGQDYSEAAASRAAESFARQWDVEARRVTTGIYVDSRRRRKSILPS